MRERERKGGNTDSVPWLSFNMDTPIHGKEITFQPLPPIEYDEVTETWFAKEEIAQSTISLMRDLGWI